ncbi:MAG: IclR family transcriptional regulator [Deltaproteobacteria bacterium]|nr:IclR family transcriptional regulator [Deltaproteobacteria bacterium]
MKPDYGAHDEQDKKIIKSLLKALSVIELLSEHKELGITEIANLLGMDKSAAYRILMTLKRKNFVFSNPENQKYRNGGKFYAIGQSVLKHRHFNPLLEAELSRLAEETGEVVNFAVPDGIDILVLAACESDDWMNPAARIGQRRPMYCTSLGKAVLAHYDPEHARALSERFVYEAFTERTITSPEALMRELETTRARGYSLDDMESHKSLCCVGIPLLNSYGDPLGAVSISMYSLKRDVNPETQQRYIRLLLEASARLTAALKG